MVDFETHWTVATTTKITANIILLVREGEKERERDRERERGGGRERGRETGREREREREREGDRQGGRERERVRERERGKIEHNLLTLHIPYTVFAVTYRWQTAYKIYKRKEMST